MQRVFYKVNNEKAMAQAYAVEDGAQALRDAARALELMAAKGCPNAGELYAIGRELDGMAEAATRAAGRIADAAGREAVA